MTKLTHIHNLLVVLGVQCLFSAAFCLAEPPTAQSSFSVTLPPHRFADDLLPASPFGINTAFQPDTPNLDAILQKMQQAGIKWGRQDFTWRPMRIAIDAPSKSAIRTVPSCVWSSCAR